MYYHELKPFAELKEARNYMNDCEKSGIEIKGFYPMVDGSTVIFIVWSYENIPDPPKRTYPESSGSGS